MRIVVSFCNLKSTLSKIFLFINASFFIYFLYIFILLTPFQYTYLNLFIGNFANAYKKFENDYMSISTKELVQQIPNKTNFIENNKKIKISFCGANHKMIIKELDKIENLKYEIKNIQDNNFDYIIMTNRSIRLGEDNSLKNVKSCFETFKGNDVIKVERNGLVLSRLRKRL